MKIEDTNEYKEWLTRLNSLNDRINSLKVWDDYAERLQAIYDELLTEDPRLLNNPTKG